MRSINAAGLALVQASEGFRATAYQDGAGIWTIAFGHTAGVNEGDTCTMTQAEQWLGEDLQEAERAVSRLVTVPLTDNQFAALVDFAFNEGQGRLQGSTLLWKLNAGLYDAVPDQLRRYVFAGGKPEGGRVTRRAAEAALWIAPDNTA
jgi:lysozyme